MTAIGRLWRRAPAWRFFLAAAIGCTGMAAMFPPALPHWRLPNGVGGMAGASPAGGQPSFRPTPDNGALRNSLLSMPPPQQQGRSGIVPFGGRQVPLPEGSWQELVLARGDGAEQQQIALFGRMVDGRLTGLMLMSAPGALSGAPGEVGLPPSCLNPSRLAGHIVPAVPGDDPLAHECWAIAPVDMQNKQAQDADPIMQSGLSRLGELHVQVPDRMLNLFYARTSDRGWQILSIMVPDRGGPITRLRNWAEAFAVPVHAGFDRTLTTAQLPASLVRDPG